MTENSAGPWMPATVAGYFSDPAIRTAVDALLKVGPDKLPNDLELQELDDYLAARSAAEAVKYDHAAALKRMWQDVWGRHLDAGWIAASTKTLIAEEYAVTPDQCWDEGGLAVYHSRGGLTLYTGVGFDVNVASIAFSLLSASEADVSPVSRNALWRRDTDWGEDWHALQQAASPVGSGLDFAALVEAAQEAMEEVDTLARSVG